MLVSMSGKGESGLEGGKEREENYDIHVENGMFII